MAQSTSEAEMNNITLQLRKYCGLKPEDREDFVFFIASLRHCLSSRKENDRAESNVHEYRRWKLGIVFLVQENACDTENGSFGVILAALQHPSPLFKLA